MKKDIERVHFFAVTGAKTNLGGTVIGSSNLTINGLNTVLEGDVVTYPDGNTASVMKDPSTGLECEKLTASTVGSKISNGDYITNAAQSSMALFIFKDGTSSLGCIDDDIELNEYVTQGVA